MRRMHSVYGPSPPAVQSMSGAAHSIRFAFASGLNRRREEMQGGCPAPRRSTYHSSMRKSDRPRVICYMLPSVDGRIVLRDWHLPTAHREYERTAATFNADAWIVGRISMEPYAGNIRLRVERSNEPIPLSDFIAPHRGSKYAIAVDPSGKLRWRANNIDGEHVITILTGSVSGDYLAFLRAKHVSYLFGGAANIDLRIVLRKLRSRFGIRTLLLEGGGTINGSFLAAGLIDELSVLVAPVADGSVGTPSLFDVADRHAPTRRLKLISMQERPGGIVWLRYKVL